MRLKGRKALQGQLIAGGTIGNDADIVAARGLFSGKVKDMAKQPANRRAHAV